MVYRKLGKMGDRNRHDAARLQTVAGIFYSTWCLKGLEPKTVMSVMVPVKLRIKNDYLAKGP